jgi:ribonuclease Z
LAAIKSGEDFLTTDGELVPNSRLTRPATPARRYAYCSDTAYNEKIIPLIEKVDLLFHESTFMQEDAAKAIKTFHSTAKQAASIAQKAQVKQLMLGHYSARYNHLDQLLAEAQEIFPQSILANEGFRKKL